MKKYALTFAVLAACSSEANHLGNPFTWPVNALTSATENTIYNQRRGQVEVIVKSSYPGIVDEIGAGGGPALTDAMNTAGIPVAERPARILQLQGDLNIYNGNPGALVTALMVYSS